MISSPGVVSEHLGPPQVQKRMAGHCGSRKEMSPYPATARTWKSCLPSLSIEKGKEGRGFACTGKRVCPTKRSWASDSPFWGGCVAMVRMPCY